MGPPAEDFIPRHVYVKPPDGSIPRLFPEGGGLIRRAPAEEMRGEWGWWYAYLTPYELRNLAEEGVRWRALDSRSTGIMPVAAGGIYGDECTDSAETDEFCGYATATPDGRCGRTIVDEINDAEIDYPALSGKSYVEAVHLGQAFVEGHPILGLRIGDLWSEGAADVPQLVVFAGQHAREWVTTEFAMRLLRYYAGSYRDGTNGVRALLDGIAILIVPVVNPDGYDYTLEPAGRMWRPSRQPCTGDDDMDSGIGTDVNRNHEFSRGQPGQGTECIDDGSSTYRGDGPAEGAPETKALEVALSNDGLAGQYVTRFSLNAHAYGNLLMFPEGLSSTFSPCTTNTNCSAADLGAFHDLVGTELSPSITDEETDRPYITSSIFRSVYEASGDATTEHVYGTLGDGFAPSHLGAAIELTNTECTTNFDTTMEYPEPWFHIYDVVMVGW